MGKCVWVCRVCEDVWGEYVRKCEGVCVKVCVGNVHVRVCVWGCAGACGKCVWERV